MALQDVGVALQRARTVLTRRPSAGMHDDAPATAFWENGTRVVARHANGSQVLTDMPSELGGSGDQVTPGWLFRAGLASCAATSIAMNAATQGIELTTLEVHASSRSDTRGVLAMAGADGQLVYAGPCDVQLQVRISARDVAPERLRSLIEQSLRSSPIPTAVRDPVPMGLHIEVEAD